MSRDFSPKDKRSTVYDPFGRPGAGAPIRDTDGKVKTHLIAQVEHDGMVIYTFLNFLLGCIYAL